jgi:hypothetical protein
MKGSVRETEGGIKKRVVFIFLFYILHIFKSMLEEILQSLNEKYKLELADFVDTWGTKPPGCQRLNTAKAIEISSKFLVCECFYHRWYISFFFFFVFLSQHTNKCNTNSH